MKLDWLVYLLCHLWNFRYLEYHERNPDLDRNNETLGQFISVHGYSKLFQDAYLVLLLPSFLSLPVLLRIGLVASTELIGDKTAYSLQIPMCACICWSCPSQGVLGLPASFVLSHCRDNHLLEVPSYLLFISLSWFTVHLNNYLLVSFICGF